MQKLILVYNPNSSHYVDVEEKVLVPARGLRGWMVGKYAIRPTDFEDNVANLMRLFEDGDLVIAAGGDGTASMAINAIIRSGKKVTLGALGFGNFNDIAGMLGFGQKEFLEIVEGYQQGQVKTAFPLEIKVDGEVWRYAVSYFTVGMFARSTEIFDSPKVRKKLQEGKRSLGFSLWQLAKWYFWTGRKSRLPAGTYNGEAWSNKMTDYIALNSPTMAHLMHGGDWYLDEHNYLSSVQRLGSFPRLVKFMLTSMREQVPSEIREKDVLTFAEPSTVEVHAEGEYEQMTDVREIVVKKSGARLKVVMADGDK